MRNVRIFVGALLVFLFCGTALASEQAEKTASPGARIKPHVKIGVRADMVDQIGSTKDEIEALGYKVEPVIFDDSVQPNVALAEGSIDMNWYQHKPYMQNYIQDSLVDVASHIQSNAIITAIPITSPPKPTSPVARRRPAPRR